MKLILRLFIAGMSAHSIQAIENIKAICHLHLPDDHELEIIDIYQQPELAKSYDLIGIPTLVREHPLPQKYIMGNLSDTAKVLSLLDISSKEK